MSQISSGLRAALLKTNGFKEAMDGSEFRLYSGTIPASPDDSIGSATLLVTIKNGASGVTFDDTVPGILSKPAAETWSGTNAAGGNCSFYRLVASADTGAASSTDKRVQGTVGVVGADLNLDDTALVLGAPQGITSYNVSVA